MHVVQVSCVPDRLRRSADEVLAAWPTLGSVAEAVRMSDADVTVVLSSHHDAVRKRQGVTYRFVAERWSGAGALAAYTPARLARAGFIKFAGYLKGGFNAWKESGEAFDMIINIEPDELAMDLPFDEKLFVIDVRSETEFADGRMNDAGFIHAEFDFTGFDFLDCLGHINGDRARLRVWH